MRAAPGLLLALALALPCRALELNNASAAELDGLRGVGPGLSTPMLEERAKAPFRDWADFMARIKGIGPRNAARLSEQGLRVNGQPYGRSAAPSSAPRAP